MFILLKLCIPVYLQLLTMMLSPTPSLPADVFFLELAMKFREAGQSTYTSVFKGQCSPIRGLLQALRRFVESSSSYSGGQARHCCVPADNAPVNELFSLISTPIVIAMSEINTWLFSSNFRGLFLVLSKCFQRSGGM